MTRAERVTGGQLRSPPAEAAVVRHEAAVVPAHALEPRAARPARVHARVLAAQQLDGGQAAGVVLRVADEGELVRVEDHDPPAGRGREAVVLAVAVPQPPGRGERSPVKVVELVVPDQVYRGAGRAAQFGERRLEGGRALPEPHVDAVDDVSQLRDERGRLGQRSPPVDSALQSAERAPVVADDSAVIVRPVLRVGPLHVRDDAKREERRGGSAGRRRHTQGENTAAGARTDGQRCSSELDALADVHEHDGRAWRSST